uniref:CX domain-containing protein n=1 Tax=Steinernema glaseri TaxID=37863 RepID=A0A1I7Y5R1_9BILA
MSTNPAAVPGLLHMHFTQEISYAPNLGEAETERSLCDFHSYFGKPLCTRQFGPEFNVHPGYYASKNVGTFVAVTENADSGSMISLLVGFIVPAVLFALFGILACFRKTVSHGCRKQSYTSLDQQMCFVAENQPIFAEGCWSNYRYSSAYRDNHFIRVGLPPSYSESMKLSLPADGLKVQSCDSIPTKALKNNAFHKGALPRNQAKVVVNRDVLQKSAMSWNPSPFEIVQF